MFPNHRMMSQMTVASFRGCMNRVNREMDELFPDWPVDEILSAVEQIRDWFKAVYVARVVQCPHSVAD